MNAVFENYEQFRVLLVEPDEELAQDMMRVLQRSGADVDHVCGHLKALALSEDISYSCYLVATRGLDLSGLELCALIRGRESRRSIPPAYVALYGPEADHVAIFSSPHVVDDCMSSPSMDLELEWRIKRAMHSLSCRKELSAGCLLDADTGLLTQEGLRTFLHEEVNRLGRRQGCLSISVLSVPDLGGLRASYGADWLEWFSSGIWASLRRQLRNYDRLAAMENGYVCLISPDLEEEGTRSLLGRLASAIGEYQLRENEEPTTRISLAARYLCVRVLGDYRQFGRTGDVLWNWLLEKMAEPRPEGIMGYTGSVALNLEYALDVCSKD